CWARDSDLAFPGSPASSSQSSSTSLPDSERGLFFLSSAMLITSVLVQDLRPGTADDRVGTIRREGGERQSLRSQGIACGPDALARPDGFFELGTDRLQSVFVAPASAVHH